MLRRVLAIKNIGVFRNSAAIPNPAFAKHTFVFGANGYGKTTFCSVMRSVQSGDVAPVIGRQTLGASAAPAIDLLFVDRNRRLQDGAWSASEPRISIFDGVFVAENVHSGDAVDVAHRRNLYRVIVGQEGVGLAEQEQALAEASRAKQAELTAAERAAQALAPTGMRLTDFISLTADPNVDAKIADQMRLVEALRQAEAIRARPPLVPLPLPTILIELEPLLAKSLEGIGADAEARVAEHLAQHGMQDRGEQWLAEGMAYVTEDECPFCGRNSLAELSLVQSYQALFSEAYKTLQAEITAARRAVDEALGDRPQGQLRTLQAQNEAGLEFWRHYCTLDRGAFPALDEAMAELSRAYGLLSALFERKARAPLEPIGRESDLNASMRAIETAKAAIDTYNRVVEAANTLIAERKQTTEAGGLAAAQAQLMRLWAVKRRHEAATMEVCNEYLRLDREKKHIERHKAAVRQQLEEHTARVAHPYEGRINHFLDLFNAGFRIVRTGHGYPGGVATSTYQLLINNTDVELGDSRTPADRPSFKNTLSAGDRATLALAFFLAHL